MWVVTLPEPSPMSEYIVMPVCPSSSSVAKNGRAKLGVCVCVCVYDRVSWGGGGLTGSMSAELDHAETYDAMCAALRKGQ